MINKRSLMHISENRQTLIRKEDFAYLFPCENLKNLISNFTITFPNQAMLSDDYTILPHGSVTLVMFYLNAELHSFLFGPTTQSIRVGDLANRCDVIFIIEFHPAGFSPFVKINQKELTDKILPFSTIDYSLDKEMKRIFRTASSIDELLHKLEKRLLQSILTPYPAELSLAIKLIIQTEGRITSAEITKKVFYCSRHLNRVFNLYLGMSVKSFSRLVRINKSFQLLNEQTHTLTEECFDFYTEKLGLTAVWGDKNGPYTSFSVSADTPPCFAIFAGDAMPMFKGYEQPSANTQPDTVVAVIPAFDLDADYLRLKDAGVVFLGEPQYIEAWGCDVPILGTPKETCSN